MKRPINKRIKIRDVAKTLYNIYEEAFIQMPLNISAKKNSIKDVL